MKEVFGTYGRYYDLLYRDKDYPGEAAYVVAVLKKAGLTGKMLIEFGAGTGVHADCLERFGFSVQGIERSPEMIALAKARGRDSISLGDIRSCRIPGNFDGVLSLFHVMSYQTQDRDISSVFANAARHLKPKGLFLFDYWHTPAVKFQKPEIRTKELRSDEIQITRRATPVLCSDMNVVEVHYQIRIHELASGKIQEFKEIHAMRHFQVHELDTFASAVGFSPVVSEEFGTGREPGKETWGVCSVSRKK